MEAASAGTTHLDRQKRHAVAKWLNGLSLRLRLRLFVATIVALVAILVAAVEVRSFESTIGAELETAARQTARTVADDLKQREGVIDPADVRDTLQEIAETN